MKIVIGSDHAGFKLKEMLRKWLEEEKHEVVDMGCDSHEPCDYPDYAQKVAEEIFRGRAERGILVCGSGIGMSMVANRVPGVRAAQVFTEGMAQVAAEHTHANLLCLGGRFIEPSTAEKMVLTWLETKYGTDRHEKRVEKIAEIEKKYRK